MFQTAEQDEDTVPPPPHQVTDVYMSFIGVRFESGAARKLLPPELTPVDGNTGTICVYSAGARWGLAPFSACFAAVEVQGHDAADGSPGYYIATGYYSGRGYSMMSRDYNANALRSGSRHFRDGEVAVGRGGADGVELVTIRSRPARQAAPWSAGVRHYMGKRPLGGTNLFPIAFTGSMSEAEPISVVVADTASDRMQLARPIELLYAVERADFSLTFGRPRSIAEPTELDGELAKASLLSVFTGIGRSAALVGADSEIIVTNPEA